MSGLLQDICFAELEFLEVDGIGTCLLERIWQRRNPEYMEYKLDLPMLI